MANKPPGSSPRIAVIGGGPAGLMAAEVLSGAGLAVDLYDAMPSVGRKFLLAGKGGLNLTHSEGFDRLLSRYGAAAPRLAPSLTAFTPAQLREWAAALGISTFVGSSGRVFPQEMKAAPLLRAWLQRLRRQGVCLHVRHRWQGWRPAALPATATSPGPGAGAGYELEFATPAGPVRGHYTAVVLALGGGSWPQLGSDGAWVDRLQAAGIAVAPLRPANCGFECDWSPTLRGLAGAQVKTVALCCADPHTGAGLPSQIGDFNLSAYGIEGGLIYAFAAPLRDLIARDGEATAWLDLNPGRSQAQLAAALAIPRGRDTLSNHLRRRAGLTGAKAALLRECAPAACSGSAPAAALAAAIKQLPLRLHAPRPLAEAISSAGGVRLDAVDARWMLQQQPGIFCAGEMLDWEAPTGGYLLTACMATGRAAGQGVCDWLAAQ